MKKRILLFALPALLVLSSCANIPSTNNQLAFKEDTEAHSEIFGGEETSFELKQMNPRRTMTPGEGSLLKPKIGVQFRAPYTVGANDYIAIRFVAAIASLDTKVEWTRAAYDASGNMHGTKETVETTKAYSSLIDDGDPVAASTEGEGYHYYVVYTVYDIPETTYDNYFLVAHLKISDPSDESVFVESKVSATRFDGGIITSLDSDRNGYFLSGKINGTAGSSVFQDTIAKGGNPSNNYASFTVDLVKDDSFLIVHNDITNSKFKIVNSSCLTGEGNGIGTYFVNDGGFIKTLTAGAGAHVLYLNKSNELWRDDVDFYALGPAAAGWNTFRSAYKFNTSSDSNNAAQLLNVYLTVGDFRIGDSGDTASENVVDTGNRFGYYGNRFSHYGSYDYHNDIDNGNVNVRGLASANFESSVTGTAIMNIHCKVAGYYNIYINNASNRGWVYIDLAS